MAFISSELRRVLTVTKNREKLLAVTFSSEDSPKNLSPAPFSLWFSHLFLSLFCVFPMCVFYLLCVRLLFFRRVWVYMCIVGVSESVREYV